MSTVRQSVSVHDLVEEAKKRVVFLSICVVGLSYLMSLTSSSVWVNLPAAASLIIIFRYLSLDFEMRRKAAAYNSRPMVQKLAAQKKPFEVPKATFGKPNWRGKVSSPAVEDAIDHFTRHLVSEWVTDLWYSKLTPDREGPEELVQIINGVFGEISCRMRNLNLIDLLTRDVIHRICYHLELFRECQAKIEKQKLELLSFDQRDMELKVTLASRNKLHPALFSTESEHKVLQHMMEGLVPLAFRHEDLQCSYFRFSVRELLACTVMRPVLNMANPRFINERIESAVMNARKGRVEALTKEENSDSKQIGAAKLSSDHFSRRPDSSVTGVELVELKGTQSKSSRDMPVGDNINGTHISKDPLLAMDPRSTRSWNELPSNSLAGDGSHVPGTTSAGQWGDMLDYFSHRKTQALAPEHFENMWTKGRNYRNKDTRLGEPGPQTSSVRTDGTVNASKALSKHQEVAAKVASANRGALPPGCNRRPQSEPTSIHPNRNKLTLPSLPSDDDDDEEKLNLDETESSSTNYSSEDETSAITGLDSPTTKVWDGKNSRNIGDSHIRHPLETLDGKKARRTSKGQYQRPSGSQTGRKRSRLSDQKPLVWQEVRRTSFLSGDGQDILDPLKQNSKDDDSSDDYDLEFMGRAHSGASASSSAHSIPESYSLSLKTPQSTFLGDTFFKLRCEVLGANIVRSSSNTFAVYSISVTDAENNSWSIKRRFRHFEELHRRLKEYPEYNLHLPPKHFLSAGLDVPVIRERCKLLDEYLKKLMQLPTISGSIEVWDFLSIDSQTYMFSSTFSIVETLSVNLDGRPPEHSRKTSENKDSLPWMDNGSRTNGLRLDAKGTDNSPRRNPQKGQARPYEDSGGSSQTQVQNTHSVQDLAKKGKGKEVEDLQWKSEIFLDAASDPTLPTEWVPPNLSGPILDLVDVVLQLREGGWIRRKAFWVAKQVLQLGMGDALDDWLIEKIQLLRRGSVIASGIKRVEQILWPDGIFITKHPNRQRPSVPRTPSSVSGSPSMSLPRTQIPDQITSPKQDDMLKQEQQQKEAERRAKFVYELMIDNAPAAVVGLVGRKEYEQCAKDLYFFLQSAVCLKQLVLDLIELVLLYSFPELDDTFKRLHEEKHKFGEFNPI